MNLNKEKIISLMEGQKWMETPRFLDLLNKIVDNPFDNINSLIKSQIVERIVDERIDIIKLLD
jgi:hypothetical protein